MGEYILSVASTLKITGALVTLMATGNQLQNSQNEPCNCAADLN